MSDQQQTPGYDEEESTTARTLRLLREEWTTPLADAGDGLAEAIGWLLECLTDPSANAHDGATSRVVARQRVEAWTALRAKKATAPEAQP